MDRASPSEVLARHPSAALQRLSVCQQCQQPAKVRQPLSISKAVQKAALRECRSLSLSLDGSDLTKPRGKGGGAKSLVSHFS